MRRSGAGLGGTRDRVAERRHDRRDLPGKTVAHLGLVELLAAATGSILRLCARYGRDDLRGRLTIRGAGTDLLQMANGVIEQRLGE